ncbi:Magnesium-transporting ATPase P-type 1 [Bienertia sinuspersici]
MDCSWILTTKPGNPEYEVGVREFIDFAVKNNEINSKLSCPCYMCHNLLHHRVDEILKHLSKWEFDRTYTSWIWHGEPKDGIVTNSSLHDMHESHGIDEGDNFDDVLREVADNYCENPAILEKLLDDPKKPLYNGSKHTKLVSVLRLYNIKVRNGWTDISFSQLLDFLKEILPDDNVLPRSTYVAKKTLSPMRLPYERIHACPKDCILYQNEHESLMSCPVCNASRYKKKKVYQLRFNGIFL